MGDIGHRWTSNIEFVSSSSHSKIWLSILSFLSSCVLISLLDAIYLNLTLCKHLFVQCSLTRSRATAFHHLPPLMERMWDNTMSLFVCVHRHTYIYIYLVISVCRAVLSWHMINFRRFKSFLLLIPSSYCQKAKRMTDWLSVNGVPSSSSNIH